MSLPWKKQVFSIIAGSRNHDHGIILGSFRDHLGIILGWFYDEVLVSFLLCFHFSGTCLGHVWAHFWNTFGKLFRKVEISKSDETLPDHFSIKK